MKLDNYLDITLLSLLVSASLCAASGGSELLSGRAFKLETRLKVIRKNTIVGIDQDIVVKEFYSNTAKRARLDLHEHDEEDVYLYQQSVGYYLDAQRTLIKVSSPEVYSTKCAVSDYNELVEDLFGAMSRTDKHIRAKDWIQETDNVPSYIIGLTRLLMLAELNKNRLVLVEKEEPHVRNQLTVKYMLGLSGGRNMAIYYSKLHNNKLDLPLRIWLGMKSGGEIIVDYSNIELLNVEHELSNGPVEGEGISLLSFPLGIGCTKHLPAKILDHSMAPKVVSFRADIHRRLMSGETRPLKKSFVAYDGFIRMLRIDTMKSIAYQSADEEYSISIYDIIRHRKYNIRQQILNTATPDNVAKISVDKSRTQCASARLFTEGILNPFEPIIPLDNLIEMGEAVVRGVKAKVFEQVSSVLPPMLYPQVNFVTLDGKTLSVINPDAKSINGITRDYTITYYFAMRESERLSVSEELNKPDSGDKRDGLSQLGALLRIDIHEIVPLFTIDIYDFAWQLADAPNGDRQDELVSLYDRCSSGDEIGTNSYVQMAMDLEYVDGTKKQPASEASQMLESPITRNKALIRALCDESDLIQPIQLHDVETKMSLAYQNRKLMLKLSARFSRQVLRLYEAISIGTGVPEQSASATSAVDFNECFWDAVHRKKASQRLIFSFCFFRCFVDEEPEIDYSSNKEGTIKTSRMFNPLDFKSASAYPCQVFKLELQPDDLTKKIASRSIYNKLRGSTIRLPLIDDFGGSRSLESLTFKVKQLELSDQKWTTMIRNSKGSLENEDYLLKGLGFFPGKAKLVKGAPVLLDEGDKQQQSLVSMNYELCHSRCMANISCHSFSVCVSGQQIECLISDLEFRDATVISQISNKLAKLTYQERSNGFLSVIFPKLDDQTKEANGEQINSDGAISKPSMQIIELKLDKKCRIYNKYAIEMFRLTEKVPIKPPEKYLIGVNDEDECAESCLKMNTYFFKQMAEIKLQLLRRSQTDDNSGYDYMNDLLAIQNINMKHWCGSFRYLNLATFVEPHSLKDFIKPDKLTKNGLCMLSRVLQKDRGKAIDDLNRTTNGTDPTKTAKQFDNNQDEPKTTRAPKLIFQSYEFVYSMLYERYHGIQMKTESQQEVGESSFEQPTNNQLISAFSNEEHCARACFLQTTGLQPSCRSFDFVIETNQSSSYCVFNSITLSEARQRVKEIKGATGERQEIPIDRTKREGIEVWHFEPKSSYTLDNLVLAKLMGLPSDEDEITSAPISLGTFGMLLVVVSSLMSGLYIGLMLGKHLSQQVSIRRESIENPSRNFLNSLVGSDSSNVSHRRFESDLDLPELPFDSGSNEQMAMQSN